MLLARDGSGEGPRICHEQERRAGELTMKKLVLIGAAALTFAFVASDQASAQRGLRSGIGIGGGIRGGAPMAGGFRGVAVGGAYRGVGAVGIRPGGYAIRSAAIGPRYAVRAGVVRQGWGVIGRPGWRIAARQAWRWRLPIVAGIAATGYYGYGYDYGTSYGYADDCLVWDGHQWVSVCYPYSTYPYSTAPYPIW
jgi:hypothetical protein